MKSSKGFVNALGMAVVLVPLLLASCVSAPSRGERIAIRGWMEADYDRRLAQWPVPFEIQDLSTRFGRTRAIVSGPDAAPPVLLFHARGMNALTYAPNVASLSRERRVFAVDTIGDEGRSIVRRDYPESGRDYADWVADLVAATGAEKACLVGNSMGGWITTCAATYHPERVERLVLISPAAGIPLRTTWSDMIFSILTDPSEKNVRRIGGKILGRGAANRDWNENFYHATQDPAADKLGMPSDLSDTELQRITAPTLLLIGDEEVVYVDSKEVVDRARRLIPRLTAESIPRAGHIGQYDNPEFVNAEILRFLERG